MSQTKAQLLAPIGVVTFTGVDVTGDINGNTASFTGNVSIGGTLTYEDVTNIDSVGLITARKGINVTAGVSTFAADIDASANINANGNIIGDDSTNISGIASVTATQYFGDGSQLTGIDATAIQTGNTSVQTVDTGSDGHVKMTTEGSERVRVGPAGQIGLGGANYGDSGQVMTSGGSGAAPNWVTISSAPEVTGISSGSITAGQPTIVNHDGTLSGVAYSYSPKATLTSGNGGSPGNTMGDAYWSNVGYDSNRKEFLYYWQATQQSNDPLVIAIGKPTGAATGTNVITVLPTTSSNKVVDGGTNGIPYRIAWSHTSQLGVALYRLDSNGIYVKAFTSDGTTLTFGGQVQVCAHNGTSDFADISWDKTEDKFLVVVGKDASDSNYCNAWVISHSGTTLTTNTKVQVKASLSEYVFLKYDADNNKHLLCYADNTDSNKLCGRIITVSGTTPTIGAETKDSETTYNGISVDYIGDGSTLTGSSGKFVIAYNRNNICYARIITISGTTVTFGTESSSLDNMTSVSPGEKANWGVTASYDHLTGKAFVGYLYSSGPSDCPFRQLTLDTTANTISNVGSREWIRGSGTGDVNWIYAADWMMHSATARTSTAGATNTILNYTTGNKTTNITAESFLGVANASYTDGQTATIRVSGSTQDNQVGLTTGQNYFVQDDGTLGLSPADIRVYAGTSISDTKILVGKEADSGMVRLHSGSWTGSSPTVELYDGFTTDYLAYKIVFEMNNSAGDMGAQLGNASAWENGSGDYRSESFYARGGNAFTNTADMNFIRFHDNNLRGMGELFIGNPMSTEEGKILYFQGFSSKHMTSFSGQTLLGFRGGILKKSAQMTRVRFISENNLTLVKWIVYGMK